MAYTFTKTWHTKPYPFISSTRPELSTKGKNVVITGGGSGIGKDVAVAFAQAGAKSISVIGRRADVLAAAERDIASAATSNDITILSATADLVDREQTFAAFESLAQRVGKLDVLVANVGAYLDWGHMATYSASTLMKSLELNVVTTLHASQAFLSFAAPGPVLLHTTSDMACMPAKEPWHGSGAYSVGKAAALKMMDYIAAENPHVRVVNVQPGWIPTDLTGHTEAAPDSGMLSLPPFR